MSLPSIDPTPTPLAALFEAHAAFVWRVLKRHGVPERELPDAVQEVFLVVHRRQGEFEGRSAISSWLYGIAMRVASRCRRRAHMRHEVLEAEPPEHAHDAEQVQSCDRARTLGRLDEALGRLSDEQRGAFILYEIEDLTLAEVAEAQGCPPSTAASRLYAARRELQRLLGDGECP